MLGPLFALPRTGAVSFELAVVPFLSGNAQMVIGSLIFTAIFFAVSYFMALNPNKIVDIVGKFLTPVLLAAIALISIGTFTNPAGPISAPTGDYATIPFFKMEISFSMCMSVMMWMPPTPILLTARPATAGMRSLPKWWRDRLIFMKKSLFHLCQRYSI